MLFGNLTFISQKNHSVMCHDSDIYWFSLKNLLLATTCCRVGMRNWIQFAVDIIENMIFFFFQLLAMFSTKLVASCKCGLPASFDIFLDGKPCEEFPIESPSAWCKNCTCQLCPDVPQSENCIKPEWKEGCQLILDATTNETMFSGLPEVNGVNVGTATAKILVEDCCNTIK